MSTNPYQSPQAESASLETQPPLRREALKSVRKATLLLTAAGYFNLYVFGCNYYPFRILSPLDVAMIAFQVMGTAAIAIACWFLLLPLLEFTGRLIHNWLSPRSDTQPWSDAIYVSLKPAAKLAVAGVILWVTWVIGFYDFRIDFFVISYAVGIPAHILAACLYVPLLFRWYKLWRSSVPRADSETT
ncbi:hypothetical protein [Bremerella sp.]|uniref:hypothetical protein n=1 Tax=Bremerella sp. TaxID=2795602 RepID=UPI00391D517B